MTPASTDNQAAQPAPPAGRKAGRNVPVAIGVGLVLGGWIIGSLLWWEWGFVLFVAIALTFGTYEVGRALRHIDMHASIVPIVVGTPLMILASYGLAQLSNRSAVGLAVIIAGLSIITLICLVLRLRDGVRGYVKDVAASLFVISYVTLLGSTMILMLAAPNGAMRVICYMACIVACDTGAFAVGSLIGRHKMVPSISPAKSWEGFIGGVVTAMIVGALLVVWLLAAPWWVGAILGLFLAIFGAIGDLVESAIKRDVGIKDMGNILPAHGGAMDRLDSLLLGAPVAWVIMTIALPTL